MPSARSSSAREGYVRPPIVAREPLPRWLAVWRFRILTLIIALGLAIVIALMMLKFVVHTEQNPTFGLRAPVATSAPALSR